MPRCLRPFWIALALFLVLIIGAILAFNLHLQSGSMQEQLRRGAIEAIGLPLNVRSVVYTPWDGICLRGLVMPDVENAGINFLEASEFRIFFRLFPLLKGELIVSRLSLKDALLTWRQNSGGKWRVPKHPEEAIPTPAGTTLLARPEIKAEPFAEKPTSIAELPPQPAGKPLMSVRVEEMEVTSSQIIFENRDGWPLLDADGITALARLDHWGNATGWAEVPEAILAGLLVVRHLKGNFELVDGLLTLPDISGEVAGGQLSGHGSIATRNGGSPFAWKFRLEEFQMSELHLPSSFGDTHLEGELSADFNLEGQNSPQRKVEGSARVELARGRLVPSTYLQGLGQVIGIRELQGMDLTEAYIESRIEDNFIHIEPLWLRTNEIAVEIRGPITHAGRLDLKGKLLLSPPIVARLTALTRQSLPVTEIEGLPGYREVSFQIGGTLDKPQSNLASRLLGGGIGGQVGEFFLNFFGTP